MHPQIRILTGSLLAVSVALAVAAPPRLTGQGQADKEAVPLKLPGNTAPAASLPKPEPVPLAPPKEASGVETQAAAPQANDTTAAGRAALPAPAATGNKPVSTDQTPAEKSGWAAFWEMFRRPANGKPERKTDKPDDRLVTTHAYHKETYQLLHQADLHRFAAGQEDPWQVHASKVMCTLSQTIGDYGHVEFRQGVGQPLVFALYVQHAPAGAGQAHVRSEAPRWQHYAAAKDLGVLQLQTGEQAVTASSEWSRRLLLELTEGMQPVMRYWDAADATGDMEVALSAINFRNSLALFHKCLGQLQRYDVQKTRQTVVNFNEDSTRLRPQAIEQIKDALEIYRNDSRISVIELEVYTRRSALERYDFRLATRRIRAVRDYFIKQGVDENKIQIKIHTKKEAELKKLGYSPSDVLITLRYDKPAK